MFFGELRDASRLGSSWTLAPFDLDHLVPRTTEPDHDFPVVLLLDVEVRRKVIVRVEPDLTARYLETVNFSHGLP